MQFRPLSLARRPSGGYSTRSEGRVAVTYLTGPKPKEIKV